MMVSQRESIVSKVLMISGLVLAVLCMIAAVILIKWRERKLTKERLAQVDPVTGSGNLRFFQINYDRTMNLHNRYLYYLSYLAMNAA